MPLLGSPRFVTPLDVLQDLAQEGGGFFREQREDHHIRLAPFAHVGWWVRRFVLGCMFGILLAYRAAWLPPFALTLLGAVATLEVLSHPRLRQLMRLQLAWAGDKFFWNVGGMWLGAIIGIAASSSQAESMPSVGVAALVTLGVADLLAFSLMSRASLAIAGSVAGSLIGSLVCSLVGSLVGQPALTRRLRGRVTPEASMSMLPLKSATCEIWQKIRREEIDAGRGALVDMLEGVSSNKDVDKDLSAICKGLMSMLPSVQDVECKTLSTAQQFEIESAIKLYAPWKKDATKQLHSRLQPVFAPASSLLPAADADSAPHLQPRQSLLADDGCVNVCSKGGLVNIRNLRLPSALDTTVATVKELILTEHQVIEASAAPARCSHV